MVRAPNLPTVPVVLILVLLLAACSPVSPPGAAGAPRETTATTADPAVAPVDEPHGREDSPTPPVPVELADFPTTEIELEGRRWRVAVADTPERRARGLMGVRSLGELDGMLFVFLEDTRSRFWMKDTLIPLDIGFFAADGSLVEVMLMEPCREEPCPTYGPDLPYRWALETPAGGLADLSPDARLAIPGD